MTAVSFQIIWRIFSHGIWRVRVVPPQFLAANDWASCSNDLFPFARVTFTNSQQRYIVPVENGFVTLIKFESVSECGEEKSHVVPDRCGSNGLAKVRRSCHSLRPCQHTSSNDESGSP